MNDLYDSTELNLDIPITEERPWAVFAACRDMDPDMFFPTSAEEAVEAQRVCRGCAVRYDCLEFALETRVRFGVWGGTTDKQRRSLLRRTA
jgi:WhiB family redox-sensing transcriptional regulator